jgi:hypothetical protein
LIYQCVAVVVAATHPFSLEFVLAMGPALAGPILFLLSVGGVRWLGGQLCRKGQKLADIRFVICGE